MAGPGAKNLIIAIDGPAGSGKSTVSKLVAKKLCLLYIDTGAMYRALTLKAMNKRVNLEDEKALTDLAKSTKIELKYAGSLHVILDGEDVSGPIRTPEVTANVKYIARTPGVRHEMVKLQRALGENQGGVLEGRDIGTVVFPDADYKFYLDASPQVRAKRRLKDLLAIGKKSIVEDVKKDIIARDESDMNRDVGALKIAPGAIVVDTTNLSIDQVVETLISHIV
ncbi:MAG: (d)CMP kinase [Candidatus Omnitrophota bacterium]|nr:(d)CMP kinase [Candidatus Omnitrophota bacterium]